ncbi:histidine kinase [Streptomyces sp900116325]|uniref:histidine kinase n=1 Tax=Streptomyces sp. 900116325 TaxID=3154295 RepID=UPI003331A5B3
MYKTTAEDESAAGAGTAGFPRMLDPGTLLATAMTVAAGLSVASLWRAVPTVITAFLAGRRPGRTRPTALVLVAVLAAGVVAASTVPAWLALGSRFVGVVVLAAMLPWFVGRFWRQYQELIRAGWERAEHLEREQRLVAEQARLLERARIAQDMHDVLGHDLSLIALSAGALARARSGRPPSDGRPGHQGGADTDHDGSCHAGRVLAADRGPEQPGRSSPRITRAPSEATSRSEPVQAGASATAPVTDRYADPKPLS